MTETIPSIGGSGVVVLRMVSAEQSGLIALVGSGEFTSQMEAVDFHLLEGRPARAAFLPTAAGEEGETSIRYWLALGDTHYRKIGVEPIPVPVLTKADANDPELAALISNVGLIYLSGGNPGYVANTLRDSLVWEAIVRAWRNGASLAGCSAGAGALTTQAADVRRGVRANPGLSLVPNLAVIPHYDKMAAWRPQFLTEAQAQLAPGVHLIGVDEDTALVGDLETWTVMGRQSVHVLSGQQRTLAAGDKISFD